MKKLKNALAWRGKPLYSFVEKFGCPTYNFVSEDYEDFESLGFEKDNCILMHSKYSWANVVAEIGMFQSAGQAKKNNWDIPIEPGYAEALFTGRWGEPLFVFIFKTVSEPAQLQHLDVCKVL